MRELSGNQRECMALITELIDGKLSGVDRDRFNELCRQDQGCRKLYAAVVSVHGMLLWSSQLSAQQEEELEESDAFLYEIYEQARLNRIKLDAEVQLAKNLKSQATQFDGRQQLADVKQAEPRPRVIIIPRIAVYSGLAAAVLLAMVLFWPLTQSRPARQLSSSLVPSSPEIAEKVSPEARLIRSRDAVWDRTGPSQGVFAGEGAWTLKQGFAEITMPSGVAVILHGPTTFCLVDDNTLALDQGRLIAEVPDRAKYFTVKTRSMDVVDLGTRFGVTAQADGASSASVFEGEVEVHESELTTTRAPRVVALTAGQQMRANASGKLAESVTAVEPDHGYIARWDAIARRVRVEGQARFFNMPPASVRHNDLSDTNMMIVFEESTTVLDQPIEAMVDLPQRRPATFTKIPASRRVASYFIHTQPEETDLNSFATATLTFPGRILGVLGSTKSLRDSTDLFGLESVSYISKTNNNTYGIDPGSPDYFAIGGLQGDTLTIHLAAGEFADQVRVLVEVPDELDG